MKKFKSVLKWTAIVIVAAFVLLIIARIPHAIDADMTVRQVAKIHATKLTLDDVMGKYLPPDPGAEADKTIAGIDANKNGIRDDVELAIFKEYPNSAKTRAVLLQYALALQMDTIQPIMNEEIATEIVREQSRADVCVSDTLVPRASPESWRNSAQVREIDSYINFVQDRQRNNPERKRARVNFAESVRSYSESDNIVCDINFSSLSI